MITYKWDLVEREFNPPVVANKSSFMFIAYSLIKFQDHGHRKKTQTILALNTDPSVSFNLQRFLLLLLDLQLLIDHQRKTHRLDKTEKHHTSTRTSMHSKHTRLEQYTNQWKDSKSNLHIATITHTRKAH